MQQEKQELVEKIASQAGKANEDIEKLISEKKQRFSGLLTDSGAAYMVARDLGIELEPKSLGRQSISQLQPGMQNVDVLVRVMQIFAPKRFEKNGKRGKLCNLLVADQTGEIRLTVWHEEVKNIIEKKIQRGSVLLLRNCYVKSFNDRLQLSLGYNGKMELDPDDTSVAELPEAKSQLHKLNELSEGMNDVSVVARVLRLFPATQFEKEDKKGSVMNFLIGDETGSVRAAAWNDLVDEALLLRENDVISIEGAYTKKGLKGVELHLGWRARLFKNEDASGLPEAEHFLKEQAEKKKITEISPDMGNVAVEGTIVAVNQGPLYYRVCPQCEAKLQKLEEGLLCEKCGEVKEPGIKAVVSVRLDDGSGQINAVAYGGNAEKLMGIPKEQLQGLVAEKGNEAVFEQLQQLNGKQAEFIANLRQNRFNEELELVIRAAEVK